MPDPNERALRAVGTQGAKTRTRLLDAARSAFSERGYPSTRVDDITQAAGTSHGAFYLYFANKQDIMEALADETSGAMFALADKLEGIQPGEAGYQHLRRWITEFVDIYRRDSSVVSAWIQAADETRFVQLGREVLQKFAGRIAHVIHESVRADERHPIEPTIAATALVAMIERFCYFWLVYGGPFPRDGAIETLTAIWYQAIFGIDPADRGSATA
ncbi:MAG: TetR/AcrR family transcriptional regulator [Actinomycetota bacterium]